MKSTAYKLGVSAVHFFGFLTEKSNDVSLFNVFSSIIFVAIIAVPSFNRTSNEYLFFLLIFEIDVEIFKLPLV